MKPIRIFDIDFNFMDEVDDYESLVFKRKWHKYGEFQVVINENKQNVSHFQIGNIIILGWKKAGIIRHVEKEIKEDGKGSENVVVKGNTLGSFLQKRITMPPSGYAYDRINSSIETIMKEYVDRNAVNPTDNKRKIPDLTIASNLGRGTHITYQTRLKQLEIELEKLAVFSGLGWEIEMDVVNKQYVFEVYEGRNLTIEQENNPPVLFSVDFDNTKSQKIVDSDINYKNVGYIGGQGEGVNRKIIEIGGAEGHERIEIFIDARDIENEEDLPIRGEQKLSELQRITSFDSEVLTNSNFEYEKDWDLGDIVTIQNLKWQKINNNQITEITEIFEPDGFRLDVVFGRALPTLIEKIKQEIDKPIAENISYTDLDIPTKTSELENDADYITRDEISLTSVTSVAGKTGAVTLASSDVGLGSVNNESKATMFTSPTFTGVPVAPTATVGTNTTQIATTAFVRSQGYITAAPVTSVAGKTGAVTLTSSDVGLESVENKSSTTIRSEIVSANVTTALGYTPVRDGGNTPEIASGNETSRPSASGNGRVYLAIDTKRVWKDTGIGVWTQMGGQELPIASNTVLGGIKVGANLSITGDGTLNANDNPASFIRKQERFTVGAGQTVFNLIKGTYMPNSKAITWFLNGDKQDDSVLNELSSTSVGLPVGLPEGNEVMFEYYEVINWHPFPSHSSEHLTGGVDPILKVTAAEDGLMSKEDKVKLNGIANNANNYSHPNHTGDVTSTADGLTMYNNTVPVSKGGTGQTTLTTGEVLVGAGTEGIATLSRSGIDSRATFPVASHSHNIVSDTTGTLTAIRGGTGISSYIANNYVRALNSTTLEQRTPAQVVLDIGAATATHGHTFLTRIDDRDRKPADTASGVLEMVFTSLGGMTGIGDFDYQDMLVLNSWIDTSGGAVNALVFDKSEMRIRHYQAAQTATNWGTPKELSYSDHSHTPSSVGAVNRAGDTMTGNLTLPSGHFTQQPTFGGTVPNPELGRFNPLFTALSSGTPLYPDEEFVMGSNSVAAYNNSGGSAVSFVRQADASAPNRSGMVLAFTHTTDATTPNHGGFVHLIQSRRNAVFILRFRARLPVGYSFVSNSNSVGTNSSDWWITPVAGTGKWEEYVRVIHCGNSEVFSTSGHVSITGGSRPFSWQLASCNVYEVGSPHAMATNNPHAVTAAQIGAALGNHTHGNITNAGAIGSTTNLPLITGTNGVVQAGSFGTAVNTFCQGNDARLSDARTPLTHTHTRGQITDMPTMLSQFVNDIGAGGGIKITTSAVAPSSPVSWEFWYQTI